MLRQKLLDPHGHLDRMRRNFQIQIFCKKRIELNPQQTPLRKHRPLLLHQGKKSRNRILFRENYGFSKQCAHLCTSNIEHVAQFCQICKCHVCSRCTKSIAQTRTV